VSTPSDSNDRAGAPDPSAEERVRRDALEWMERARRAERGEPAALGETADASKRHSSRARATSIRARDLWIVLGLGALGALGLVPGSRGGADPLSALVWITLIAPAAGHVAGRTGVRVWPVAPVAPVAWLVTIAMADAVSRRDLPAMAWCAPPVVGLFALGFASGRWFPNGSWRATAGVALVTALLAAAPLAGSFLRRPPPPRVAAGLLDVSPVTLTAECAGVDWMRHPPIYDAASTVDIDPSTRTPYEGRLAGLVVFVVGCVAASVRGRSPVRPETA